MRLVGIEPACKSRFLGAQDRTEDRTFPSRTGAFERLTMLCQHLVDAPSGSGDSGSPVFELLQNRRIVLAGILWGGAEDGTDFVFSDLTAVEAELGAFDFFE
jgi:hypothetical protein